MAKAEIETNRSRSEASPSQRPATAIASTVSAIATTQRLDQVAGIGCRRAPARRRRASSAAPRDRPARPQVASPDSSFSGSWLEPVAGAPDRDQPARPRGIGLDLLAQPANVHGHGRGVAVIGDIPEPVEQVDAAERDPRGSSARKCEQVELLRRQRAAAEPASGRLARRRIDVQIAEARVAAAASAAGGAASVCSPRRIALTRATISRGENGLAT